MANERTKLEEIQYTESSSLNTPEGGTETNSRNHYSSEKDKSNELNIEPDLPKETTPVEDMANLAASPKDIEIPTEKDGDKEDDQKMVTSENIPDEPVDQDLESGVEVDTEPDSVGSADGNNEAIENAIPAKETISEQDEKSAESEDASIEADIADVNEENIKTDQVSSESVPDEPVDQDLEIGVEVDTEPDSVGSVDGNNEAIENAIPAKETIPGQDEKSAVSDDASIAADNAGLEEKTDDTDTTDPDVTESSGEDNKIELEPGVNNKEKELSASTGQTQELESSSEQSMQGEQKEAADKTENKPSGKKVENEYLDLDFSKSSADEILEIVKALAHYDDVIKADRVLRRMANPMNAIRDGFREKAKSAFTSKGESEDDFSYKQDALFDEFDANFRLVKDRKSKFVKDLERQKEINRVTAEDLLDRLRKFLEEPETTAGFKKFKEFQIEWKRIGPLPGSNYRSLWANYNALVTLFYDHRSIYFELIDLDRKKNLEIKTNYCEKAEALEDVKELKDAIIQLNELHNEFKHTGPVPRDQQENIWQRFKAASDKVYARRKEYNVVLKKQLDSNLEIKQKIAEEAQVFIDFTSDRIKEWNTKSREIMELQKSWERAGGLPREKAKEVNKRFWGAFKVYFNNKNKFFKKIDSERIDNLKLKEELVSKASELKDSSEWEITAKALKDLQKEWKELGPVPEKFRNEIYQKFKEACDYFFNKRRESTSAAEKDFEVNLLQKQEIIRKIRMLTESGSGIEEMKNLQHSYFTIGYVPKSSISSLQKEFNEAIDEFLEKSGGLDKKDIEKIRLENIVEKLKHSPNANKKLNQKEHGLRKQISKIENDMTLWKNNIEFFANTKNAEKLKSDFRKKIDSAGAELERLKQELRLYALA